MAEPDTHDAASGHWFECAICHARWSQRDGTDPQTHRPDCPNLRDGDNVEKPAPERPAACVLAWDEGGDWVGLYVNGRLALEGHSLSTRDVLTTLGHSFEERTFDMQADDWLGLPDLQKDLPDATA